MSQHNHRQVTPSFEAVITQCAARAKLSPYPHPILCLDPGETTGWAVMRGSQLIDSGQLLTKEIGPSIVNIRVDLVNKYNTQLFVIEEYRVYKNKIREHIGSEVYTSRLIGAIEALAYMKFQSVYKHSAAAAKGFVTDKLLKEWNFWITGQRHARDAIRHGIYWQVFTQFHSQTRLKESHNV